MAERIGSQIGENYDLWYKNFPEVCTTVKELIPVVVDLASLSANSHNHQQFKFEEQWDGLSVSVDSNRDLGASDPTHRQMYITLGAVVGTAKVAAQYYGFSVEDDIVVDGEGNKSKKLRFEPGLNPTEEDKILFLAIQQRVSNRNAHTDDPIPNELRNFIGSFSDSSINIDLITNRESLGKLGIYMHEADGEVLQNPGFKGELARAIKPNYTADYDGMPGFGFGVSDVESIGFGAFLASGMMANEAARGDLDLFTNKTASVGVISTTEDTPEAWMQAGEDYSLIALRATSMGFSANVLAALVELPTQRKKLQSLINTEFFPQVMFRLGKPVKETPHAPRRPSKFAVVIHHPDHRDVVAFDKPTILSLEEGGYSLTDLQKEIGSFRVNDRYIRNLADLYKLDHPDMDLLKEADRKASEDFIESRNNPYDGIWVYRPWDNELVHLLGETEFRRLLYSRNKPCILPEEQEAIGKLTVAIGGLSVGSNIAVALAKMGVENMIIADPDTIDLSNESRMAVGDIGDIGESKVAVLSRVLYGINPFINLTGYPEGFGSHNVAKSMSEADIFIDHMDNLPLKIELRKLARVLRKTIIMATDIDKRPTIEIETPNRALFNGRVPKEIIDGLMVPPKSFAEWCKKAVQIFGFDNASAPVLENFVANAMKEQNYGSQLGLTGNVVAGLMAYYVYEFARGNVDRLTPFRIVPIEQEDLIDQDRLQSAREAYIQEIGL